MGRRYGRRKGLEISLRSTYLKVSKKRAAELMLDKLKQLPPVASALMPKPRKVATGKKKSRNLIKVEQKEGGGGGGGELGQSINPISRLIQIQQARKEKEPVYTLIAERGMPRRREFVMQVCRLDYVE